MTRDKAVDAARRMESMGGLWVCVTRSEPEGRETPDPNDDGWSLSVSVTVETLT